MKRQYKLYPLALGLIITQMYGMPDPTQDLKQVKEQREITVTPRSIGSIQLSPATILGLAPKTPEAVSAQTQQWLTNNKPLINTALGFEPLIGPMKPFHVTTNEMITKMGLKNMSDCNYVINPIDGLLIKIAGHFNRKENLNWLAGDFGRKYEWGRLLDAQDYKAIEEGLKENECDQLVDDKGVSQTVKHAPKTYQTVSRMFYYLLFQQAKEKLKLEGITAPAMYLEPIPGRPKNIISDRNYVIVEEQIKGLTPIQALTPLEAQTIQTVIKAIGLFCCSKDNIQRTPTGEIAFLDFEQPNNENPRQFFHGADWKFKHNVEEGLKDFAKNFLAK